MGHATRIYLFPALLSQILVTGYRMGIFWELNLNSGWAI